MREKLSLQNLGAGLALQKANQALDRIVADSLARVEVDKPRVLILKVAIKPTVYIRGGFVVCKPEIEYGIQETYPPILGPGMIGSVSTSKDGEEIILVDVDFPSIEAEQKTILDEIRERKRKEKKTQ